MTSERLTKYMGTGSIHRSRKSPTRADRYRSAVADTWEPGVWSKAAVTLGSAKKM